MLIRAQDVLVSNRRARPKGRRVGENPERQAMVNRLNTGKPFEFYRDEEGNIRPCDSEDEGIINLARAAGHNLPCRIIHWQQHERRQRRAEREQQERERAERRALKTDWRKQLAAMI